MIAAFSTSSSKMGRFSLWIKNGEQEIMPVMIAAFFTSSSKMGRLSLCVSRAIACIKVD
jgi:hypothetical protein